MPLYTPGRRRAIVLLLLTSVLLLTLDLRGNAVIDAVRTGYNKVLEPFESAADVVTRPIRERVARDHRLRRPGGGEPAPS